MSTPAAARETDYIVHNEGQFARFLGFIVWLRYGTRAVQAVLAFFGPAGWTAIAVGFAVEWVLSTALEAALEKIGEMIEYKGEAAIATGSSNVWINGLKAARGDEKDGDTLSCHGGAKIKEGSQWVSFNKKPAARITDRTECSGKLSLKPESVANVFIGGPPIHYDNKLAIHEELKGLFTWGKVYTRSSLMKMLGEAAKEGGNNIADALWQASKPHLTH